MYAKDKIPFRNSNLILFFISNLTRGWIGQILFIVFIGTIAWGHRTNVKLTLKKAFILSIIAPFLFIISSFLMYIKLALRLGRDAVIDLMQSISYTEVFSSFFETLLSRLQLISTVLFQLYHKNELTQFIENGTVGNFYTDGLPQQTIFKILDVVPGENLNLFLWKHYMAENIFEIQTTFQPGLVGWLYLLPYYWILPFVAYIVFLVLLNFKLIGFIGGNGLRHLSWFAMLIFLIPSWLGAYISFIFALCIFVGILLIISRFTKNAFDS